MAITVVETPKSYNPIYNDNVVLLSSNLTSNPKFKFVLDVELQEGATFISLGRFKCPAISDIQTGTIRGYFNLSQLLSSSIFFSTKDVTIFDKKSYPVRVTPGEEYAASPTAAPVYYPASGQVFTYVGFNGSLRLKEYIDFVPSDLIDPTIIAASSGIAQYPLTTYRLPRKVLKSTISELTFLTNGGTNTRAIASYYINNALITTQTISLTTVNNTDVTIDASYSTLAVPPTTDKIGIRIERISNGEWLSNQYEYDIVDACSKFDKVNVYFQNKWGGMDAFVFNMRETVTDQIERKNYQKMDRYIQTYNAYNQASQTYASTIKTTHLLNTDWVTEAEMNWLSELAESNNVLISYNDEYIEGTRAQFTLTITKSQNDEWEIFNSQTLAATKSGPVSLTLTLTGGGPTYSFADDLYYAEIEPVIGASNWATYFDIDASGVDANNIVLVFTAKAKGTSYNLTSITDGDQMTVTGYTDGTNETLPTLIPVTVDNNSFEWKKSTVDKLFQLELRATETSLYNRQTQ
jgi:hypothetical protein